MSSNLPPGWIEPSEGPCVCCGVSNFEDCICPECPKCGVAGDPDCYPAHGLEYTEEQIRSRARLYDPEPDYGDYS